MSSLRQDQIRVAREMALDFWFAVVVVIQTSKPRCRSAKRPNQAQLRPAEVNDQAEPNPFRECQAVFALCLHFCERISDRQTNRDQLVPAIGSERKIANTIRGIKRATHELSSARDVLCPWHDHGTQRHVGPRLIARQATLLDQVIAQLSETESL
jgi:hypothetical protein